MPSHRQSVATRTRCGVLGELVDARSRVLGGSVPGDRLDLDLALPSACAGASATYSAVAMKRQKTIGLYPSANSSLTSAIASLELRVLVADERLGLARQLAEPAPLDRRRRRLSSGSASAPGATSTPSSLSSSIRSRTLRRPISSALGAASRRPRLRRGSAASRRRPPGWRRATRSSASADHQRTRWRCGARPRRRARSRARRRGPARTAAGTRASAVGRVDRLVRSGNGVSVSR